MNNAWVNDTNVALFTDLYELTMLQAYLAEEMHDEAVFSLVVRRLPPLGSPRGVIEIRSSPTASEMNSSFQRTPAPLA